jgi:hypothetical protein
VPTNTPGSLAQLPSETSVATSSGMQTAQLSCDTPSRQGVSRQSFLQLGGHIDAALAAIKALQAGASPDTPCPLCDDSACPRGLRRAH